MVSDTWHTAAVPIMISIAGAENQGNLANFDSVTSATGLEKRLVERELRVLVDGGYVQGIDTSSSAGFDYISLRLRERGKRIVGEWPGEDAFRVLVELVDERIEQESDPDKRRSFAVLKDGLTAVGTGAGANLLADVLRSIG